MSNYREPERFTDPTTDPANVYPPYPGIPNTYKTFRLGRHAKTHKERDDALKAAKSYLTTQKSHFMGYQCNQALHFSHTLGAYLDMSANNIGDPFTNGNFTLNSKFMERAVLDYFASLWNARWPNNSTDPETYWGYVLSMGSTEGNLNALWTARDYLAGKKILIDPSDDTGLPKLVYVQGSLQPPRGANSASHAAAQGVVVAARCFNPANAFTPVAFFSEDTHYSIVKAMVMMSVQTFSQLGKERYKGQCPLQGSGGEWPDAVPSDEHGAISVDALVTLVNFFAYYGYPIFVCFNYGTTFKGAYDNVEAAGNRLMPIFKKYGLDERPIFYDPSDPTKVDLRTGYWIHVDGALGAAYMPFIEMAYKQGKVKARGPNFDFRLPFVHSLVMSGHKWIGCPIPCGVYMTKVKYQLCPPSRPEYLGAADTTFAGSRNAFSAMLLWDYVSRHSYEDLINKAVHLEDLAEFTYSWLKKIPKDIWVARTPLSLTVRFKRPKPSIVFKYSLSCETVRVGAETRPYAHIFLMEHVTKALVGELVVDLSRPDAFDEDPSTNTDVTTPIDKAQLITPHSDKLVVLPLQGRGFHG